MTRVLLILVVAIQLLIAMQSEGLIRALSELSAFLTILMLVFTIKRDKQSR